MKRVRGGPHIFAAAGDGVSLLRLVVSDRAGQFDRADVDVLRKQAESVLLRRGRPGLREQRPAQSQYEDCSEKFHIEPRNIETLYRPSSGFIEHADVGQPFLKPAPPGSERDSVSGLDASAVAAARVNVQISANSDLEERVEEVDSLSRMVLVINARAGQKSGSRVFRGRDVHRRRPAGVDQTDEIGAATLSLDRVGRLRLPAIEPDVRERGERAARRKTKNADAGRIDAPFF